MHYGCPVAERARRGPAESLAETTALAMVIGVRDLRAKLCLLAGSS